MNSSESEQSDNENFCNEFLFAKDNRYMLIVSCIYLFLLKLKFVICSKFCDCGHCSI